MLIEIGPQGVDPRVIFLEDLFHPGFLLSGEAEVLLPLVRRRAGVVMPPGKEKDAVDEHAGRRARGKRQPQ